MSDGVLETRHYYIQNWRADVVSLVGTDGVFPGWYKYSAYAQHQGIGLADVDDSGGIGFRDGGADIADFLGFLTCFENGDLRAGVNYDGGVDINDLNLFLASYYAGAYVPESRIMYAGYAHDPLDDAWTGQRGLYHVRHRVYSPEIGRWTRRDPIGYFGGRSLYEYAKSRASRLRDPSGLLAGPEEEDNPLAPFAPARIDFRRPGLFRSCKYLFGNCPGLEIPGTDIYLPSPSEILKGLENLGCPAFFTNALYKPPHIPSHCITDIFGYSTCWMQDGSICETTPSGYESCYVPPSNSEGLSLRAILQQTPWMEGQFLPDDAILIGGQCRLKGEGYTCDFVLCRKFVFDDPVRWYDPSSLRDPSEESWCFGIRISIPF